MKYIVLVFLSLGLSVAAISQSNLDYAKRIDSLILSRYNKGLFNGSLLVQKEGEVIYKRSFGWANVEKRDPLRLTDPMRIASITKTFTAVCVLKLVDEGRVDLHEDINTYLPEIEKTGITIHHLLSHKSGLTYINGPRYYWRVKRYQKKRGDGRMTNDDLLQFFEEKSPKKRRDVGEVHRYSNTGYAVLASLIERVTGIKYNEYLQIEVFTPYKMINSSLYLPNDINDNPEKVLSYKFKGKAYEDVPAYYQYGKKEELKFSDDIYGDKYIISTVEDINKFNVVLLNGDIISEKLLNKMLEPVLLNSGQPSSNNYGYGIYQTSYEDSLYYQHGGNLAAFEAINLFDKKGSQVVLLMNLDFSERFYIYHQILNILNGSKKKDWLVAPDKKYKKRNDKVKSIFEEKYKINYSPLYE